MVKNINRFDEESSKWKKELPIEDSYDIFSNFESAELLKKIQLKKNTIILPYQTLFNSKLRLKK